jgi:hypothetical protein
LNGKTTNGWIANQLRFGKLIVAIAGFMIVTRDAPIKL